jgi:THO complex subunit 3
VNEIAWSKDLTFLFLTTGRGGVEVMSWPSLERTCTLHAHTANCYCVKFSPSGEYACRFSFRLQPSLFVFSRIRFSVCVLLGTLQWAVPMRW